VEETIQRHDEVDSCIDVPLNFGGFMYIGTIIPWSVTWVATTVVKELGHDFNWDGREGSSSRKQMVPRLRILLLIRCLGL
jgi:hypothetical protein